MRHPVSTALLTGLLVLVASPAARADRGHWGSRVGISIGVPLGYPYYGAPLYRPYYDYPPYYYPPVVVTPAPPPVYIERGDLDADAATPGAAQSKYWYYCTASQTYYPYVKTCPAGWLTVVPDANAPHP
jgi:hypothetical protein